MKSKGEARRMIRQKAVRVGGEVVEDETLQLTGEHIQDGKIPLQVGKKAASPHSGNSLGIFADFPIYTRIPNCSIMEFRPPYRHLPRPMQRFGGPGCQWTAGEDTSPTVSMFNPQDEPGSVPNFTLRSIFICCQPAGHMI